MWKQSVNMVYGAFATQRGYQTLPMRSKVLKAQRMCLRSNCWGKTYVRCYVKMGRKVPGQADLWAMAVDATSIWWITASQGKSTKTSSADLEGFCPYCSDCRGKTDSAAARMLPENAECGWASGMGLPDGWSLSIWNREHLSNQLLRLEHAATRRRIAK